MARIEKTIFISHHPTSVAADKAAAERKATVDAASQASREEPTSTRWFERGFEAADVEAKIRFYTEAIRLKPEFAEAFNNRGAARREKGDLDGALEDYTEAIRLIPGFKEAFLNRGNARQQKGDLDGALADYTEAIRLKPDY